jgi:hypothetical protein
VLIKARAIGVRLSLDDRRHGACEAFDEGRARGKPAIDGTELARII